LLPVTDNTARRYCEHCRLTRLYQVSNPLVVGGNKLVDQITGSDSGNWKLELFLFITQHPRWDIR